MKEAITVISSMATQAVLAELGRAFEVRFAFDVAIESVGGVDAKERVLCGESFDVVALASDAIDELVAAGRLRSKSRVDLMRSGVAVAVRAGAARPRIDSEEALKRAVLAARSIGTSTGPSGVKLSRLFERWGISDSVRERVVTPKPGVPVGALIARGDVELGFQQLSELMHIEGIDVLGPLPASVQIRTTFSAGIGTGAKHPASAGALLDFMASPAAADAKRRHGMAAP
jgi:molybdate transport system substrate-binding protein